MIHQTDTESPKPVAEADSLVGVDSTYLLAELSAIMADVSASSQTKRFCTDAMLAIQERDHHLTALVKAIDDLQEQRFSHQSIAVLAAARELFTASRDARGFISAVLGHAPAATQRGSIAGKDGDSE